MNICVCVWARNFVNLPAHFWEIQFHRYLIILLNWLIDTQTTLSVHPFSENRYIIHIDVYTTFLIHFSCKCCIFSVSLFWSRFQETHRIGKILSEKRHLSKLTHLLSLTNAISWTKIRINLHLHITTESSMAFLSWNEAFSFHQWDHHLLNGNVRHWIKANRINLFLVNWPVNTLFIWICTYLVHTHPWVNLTLDDIRKQFI